jgi:uncharacterized membrane protein
MGKEPAVVIVASFEDDNIAENAMRDLKMDKRGRLIEFKDAAIVIRDEDNKIHIKETGDLSGGRGALYGGAIGALVGLIAGPIGAVIGGAAGVVVGGITAKKFDAGIPDERLTEIGASLQPGSSVILAVVERRWFEPVQVRLQEAGAEVLSEPLNDEFINQFETDRKDE